MKGLILAGGSGKRLRPLTYSGAKQLVPIANRPILFYVIDKLIEANVRDIGIIISPETGAEVRAVVEGACWTSHDGFVRFTFITQPRPEGLAHALLTAAEFIGGDDVCMMLGDNLIQQSLFDFVQDHNAADASLLLQEVSDPSKFGVAKLDEHGNPVAFEEKPGLITAKTPRHAIVGVYRFNAHRFKNPADGWAHPVLAAARTIQPSKRGEYEITDALARLLADGGKIHTSHLQGWWLDTGKKDDLLLANATVMDDLLERDIQGQVDHASQIRGRVRIEAGAVVKNSIIHGPAVIGKGARVEESRIANTSIGNRCEVRFSAIDHAVVMEDSRIIAVEQIVDSLIGRRCYVTSKSRVKLLLGDDCRVER